MKLGRKPARVSLKTPRLRNYLVSGLPPPPPSLDWAATITAPFGVMRNDELGDCTAAAGGHGIQVWTANVTQEVTVSDDDVVTFYEKTCGYVPSQPSTDLGGVELDVLTWWTKNDLAGHKITAFASVTPSNLDHVKTAIWLLGGVYIGINLPLSASDQHIWDVPPGGLGGSGAPGSWGGHAVFVYGYADGKFMCITWGERQSMTEAFFQTYVDEAYGLVSPDWLAAAKAPNGLDGQTLAEDMALLQAEEGGDAPAAPPPQCSSDTVGDVRSILAVPYGNITVDFGGAVLNVLLVMFGTVIACRSGFTVNSLVTWVGVAIAVVFGSKLLYDINASNQATEDFAALAIELMSGVKKKTG